MKNFILFIVVHFFLILNSRAQNVGIGDVSDFTPDNSAILELRSTTRGFLLPRMLRAERLAIVSPAHGLMVIQTDNSGGDAAGIWWYSVPDAQWYLLTSSSGSPWTLIGNSGTNAATNFLGTTDAVDLVFRTNNIERMRIYSTGSTNISNFLTIGTGLKVNTGGADITGNLILQNSLSVYNVFQTSNSQTSNINYVLPLTQGASTTFLMNDGSGNLSWASPTVSSISFSNITTGTINTTQTLTLGNNAILTFSGSGIVNANQFNLYSGVGATNAVDLETNEVNGTLKINNGGTGLSSIPLNHLLYGNDTNPLNTLAPPGSSSYLTSSGGAPSWSIIPAGGFLSGNGSPNQVAYYSNTNILTGSNDFLWNNTLKELSINGSAFIGGTSPTYSSSAWLDVGGLSSSAPYKGFLVPRMTDIGRLSISTPATGLLIYQTNATPGFYYYNGTSWIPLATGLTSWLLSGNSGTNAATNFLGTIDSVDLVFRTNNSERIRINANGNVGIGTSNPNQKLEVANGNMLLGTNGSSTAELRFQEKSSQGTNYIAFKADTLNRDMTFVWPKDTVANQLSVLANPQNNNLKWISATEIGAYMQLPVKIISTTDTAKIEDYIIVVRTNTTYYLPRATSQIIGKVYYYIPACEDGNPSFTLRVVGGGLIDCATSWSPTGQATGVMVVCDGSRWRIITSRRLN